MIRVYPDPEAASHAAGRSVVRRAGEAIEDHGSFGLALAGGSTPRRLYELMATEYRAEIPWQRVHIYGGDERCVAPEDDRSNYGMARTVLLDHVPVPATHVHRIRGELGPEHRRPVPRDGSRETAGRGRGEALGRPFGREPGDLHVPGPGDDLDPRSCGSRRDFLTREESHGRCRLHFERPNPETRGGEP